MEIVEEYTSINKKQEIEFRYTYRLIRKTLNNLELYGGEVERKDYKGIKNINIERERIDIISKEKDKVKKIVGKLYDGQVSPIHLIDIVGCYVDECAYDFKDDFIN